jgi:hypothetical protein
MHGLGAGGEARTECWVFVPPTKGKYTHTIIYLPCEVWFQAGLWWVLMPHQPALAMQPGWSSPGLFIPSPPRSPPSGRSHQKSVAVRIMVFSSFIVQFCFLTPPCSNRAMNAVLLCRVTSMDNGERLRLWTCSIQNMCPSRQMLQLNCLSRRDRRTRCPHYLVVFPMSRVAVSCRSACCSAVA